MNHTKHLTPAALRSIAEKFSCKSGKVLPAEEFHNWWPKIYERIQERAGKGHYTLRTILVECSEACAHRLVVYFKGAGFSAWLSCDLTAEGWISIVVDWSE